MTFRGFWSEPIAAVSLAAAAGLFAGAAFSVARGGVASLEYIAVCTALTFGAALVVGGVAGLVTGGSGLALALWAGLHGFVLLDLLSAICLALVTAGCLWLDPATRNSPLRSGLSVALALCTTFVYWPRMGFVAGKIPQAVQDPLGAVVAGAVIGALIVYARLERRWPLLPAQPVVSVSALLALFVAVPLVVSPLQSKRLPAVDEPLPNAEPLPTIILIILDTVRADRLSVYGYERDTTPVLSELVRRNARSAAYPLAFSPSSWTIPSHASLFTGLIPSDHGAHRTEEVTSFYFVGEIAADRTLAEVLRARGYRTGAILANPLLFRIDGMERGFEIYYAPQGYRRFPMLGEGLRNRFLPSLMPHVSRSLPTASAVNQGVFDFLDECAPHPCFVVANYTDAHAPYFPPPEQMGRYSGGNTRALVGRLPEMNDADVQLSADRYDECIRGLDASLGELFQGLKERNLLDDAWVIVTSDHGEGFGEHGEYHHGAGVHNEEVRIPLIILPPRGVQLQNRSDAVDLSDLTFTLSAIAGGPTLGPGRDLRDSKGRVRPIQIELFGSPHTAESPARAVVFRDVKLIERGRRRELYRLSEDPAERIDAAATAADAVDELSAMLPPLRPSSSVREAQLSPDEEVALRALGYVK